MDTPEDYICRGCQRSEMHKMCPAWGTPIYMTGIFFTKELEELYATERKKAIEEARKRPCDLN